MAKKEEVLHLMQRFKSIHHHHVFENTEMDQRGMNYVIKYLIEHDGISYTHELAREMNISTARVSNLINKLEAKSFVKRRTSKEDARKTIIEVTEAGRMHQQMLVDKLYQTFSMMIDEIGMDELNRFLDTLERLNNLMCKHEKINEKESEVC